MDLNAPLGMTPRPEPKSRAGLYASLGAVALALIAGGIALTVGDPHAGEPIATATVPPVIPLASRSPDLALSGGSPSKVAPFDGGQNSTSDRTPTGSLQGAPGHEGDIASLEHGVKVFRAPPPNVFAAPTSSGPLIINVSRALDDPLGRATLGATRSTEASPAQATAASGLKIAIFVSGMGLDEGATRTAIEIMPSAVSLAFLPSTNSVASLVDAAKARGHEVLLQLPMRDRQGTTIGPAQGPHALAAGRPDSVMAEDLDWLLARFAGYDGVTNLLGAAVSSDTTAMTAVLKAVGARHLFYLDDGTSKRSVAVSVGATLGVPTIRADLVLDATADPSVVRANLEALVAIARRKGSAIGMASGLPEHLAAIARFASELRAQGISLVPVNALASGTAAPAATSSR